MSLSLFTRHHSSNHKLVQYCLKYHHTPLHLQLSTLKLDHTHTTYSSSLFLASLIGISSFCYSSIHAHANNTHIRDPHPQWQSGDTLQNLPTFTRKQVTQHNTTSSLWLTYRHAVYDLTPFVEEHPGAAERLLLACKGNHDICNWWEQLGYHNVSEVHHLLETFRIGNISKSDFIECGIKDAQIDPILRQERALLFDTAFSHEPFIAETPVPILDQYLYTPAKYHYVRNHFPVPMHLDWDSEFTISGIAVPNNFIIEPDMDESEIEESYTLKYKEILQLPHITRDVYLQCGGHRRIEYTKFGTTKGSKWNVGAIGNGRYKGVLLRDLLKHIGCDVDTLYNYGDTNLHLWLVGSDSGPDGEPYGVSIPLYKALDPMGDVMLAFEYNNEPLTHDHGYPVRVVVPGWVGARSVKWIEQIIISDKECDLKAYTKSYRMTAGLNQEIRALPVNSAIHSPKNGERIVLNKLNRKILCVSGEAHSGDGKPIIRVDVSVDGGKVWNEAKLLGVNYVNRRMWGWSKWKCEVDVSEYLKEESSVELEIVCRAMDLSHNRQPDSCRDDLTFNPKGYAANSYHKVIVEVVAE